MLLQNKGTSKRSGILSPHILNSTVCLMGCPTLHAQGASPVTSPSAAGRAW